MRTLSRKFFAIGLLLALLVCSTGRAVPVFALAELAPEVAPVFDTQVYQLQDYIDHGGMTDPQLDIFYVLAGLYALGQFGSENYTLTNPYATKSGVLNWLKDVGIETYNTLITLAPDTVVLPNGTIMSTDMTKRALSLYVADLMGCAITASSYDTFQEFEDDVDTSQHFFIPWSSETQYGLNTMFQLYGGIYHWQFDTDPFTTSVEYRSTTIPATMIAEYHQYLSATSYLPLVRFNKYLATNQYNALIRGTAFNTYTNLFLDIVNHEYRFYDDSGNLPPYESGSSLMPNSEAWYVDAARPYSTGYVDGTLTSIVLGSKSIPDFATYPDYASIIRSIYNGSYIGSSNFYFFEDFVKHVYVGDSWANRSEIFNVKNLNLDESEQPYYVTVPDNSNYLMDIKGILQDILNNTELYNVFINNVYSPDGVLVHDTDLIRISLRILQDYEEQNPPIPVNLNDIADYTDNSYMDRVKEEAKRGGNALAALVAFWHNCDAELIYVLFGAGITVLVGAFIGKWGHS